MKAAARSNERAGQWKKVTHLVDGQRHVRVKEKAQVIVNASVADADHLALTEQSAPPNRRGAQRVGRCRHRARIAELRPVRNRDRGRNTRSVDAVAGLRDHVRILVLQLSARVTGRNRMHQRQRGDRGGRVTHGTRGHAHEQM